MARGAANKAWRQAPSITLSTVRFRKKQAELKAKQEQRDAALVRLHERRRRAERARALGRTQRRAASAPPKASARDGDGDGDGESGSDEAGESQESDDGEPEDAAAPRRAAPPKARRVKRGAARLAQLSTPAGAGGYELSEEERKHRQSIQISNAINQMIHGRRQLYGSMMRDASSTFKLIDKDGSGGLDYTEFAQAMKRLGLGLDASQTTELARMMDTDGDGEISAEEFVAALATTRIGFLAA